MSVALRLKPRLPVPQVSPQTLGKEPLEAASSSYWRGVLKK